MQPACIFGLRLLFFFFFSSQPLKQNSSYNNFLAKSNSYCEMTISTSSSGNKNIFQKDQDKLVTPFFRSPLRMYLLPAVTS